MTPPPVAAPAHHAVVVGAGNIGSHLVSHLARLPEVSRLTVIDQDTYQPENLATQAITGAHLTRAKARVQAQLARRINPRLEVTEIAAPVESLPLGLLRGSVILSCLDSWRSRLHLNQAAWHLGVPWIDAGVHADELMARISVFTPGPNQPCLECAMDQGDYAAVEQSYPCAPVGPAAPSSSPSGLGALAAALQALECQKLLRAADPASLLQGGEQVVVGARHHAHYRTINRRNPHCRLTDHEVWRIEPLALPLTTTLATLTERLAAIVSAAPGASLELRVDGKWFITETICAACATTHPTLALGSFGTPPPVCRHCGGPQSVAGFGIRDHLDLSMVLPGEAVRTLASIGIRTGEVLTVQHHGKRRHFEIATPSSARRPNRHRLRPPLDSRLSTLDRSEPDHDP